MGLPRCAASPARPSLPSPRSPSMNFSSAGLPARLRRETYTTFLTSTQHLRDHSPRSLRTNAQPRTFLPVRGRPHHHPLGSAGAGIDLLAASVRGRSETESSAIGRRLFRPAPSQAAGGDLRSFVTEADRRSCSGLWGGLATTCGRRSSAPSERGPGHAAPHPQHWSSGQLQAGVRVSINVSSKGSRWGDAGHSIRSGGGVLGWCRAGGREGRCSTQPRTWLSRRTRYGRWIRTLDSVCTASAPTVWTGRHLWIA